MSVTNNNQNNTKKEDQMCGVRYNIFEQAIDTPYGVKTLAFIQSEDSSMRPRLTYLSSQRDRFIYLDTLPQKTISLSQEYYDEDVEQVLSFSDEKNTSFYQDYYNDGPALSLSDLDTEDTEDTEEFSIAHKAAANQIPTKGVFNMKNSAACLDFYENDEELRIACRTINQLFPSQKPNNSSKRSTAVQFQDEIDASEIKFDLDKCYKNQNSDQKFWEEKIAHYEGNGHGFNECCEEEYVNEFCDNTDIEIKEKYAASIEKCIKRET